MMLYMRQPQPRAMTTQERLKKPNSLHAALRAISPSRDNDWGRALHLPVLLAIVLAFSGCGTSSTVKPQIGTIAFTNANGAGVAPVTLLTAGTFVYLDVVVANDPELLGVNWSVSCASQLPPGTPLPPGETVDESCGFFTPVHTASAPVPSYAANGSGIVTVYQAPAAQPNGGTVTIYASSTTDPSKFSSITLSIMP